ncbi:uncharacterized protein JNUCC1_02615 [Lentibacillus sp. JNUCC-1]|uniref:class I SAM-dependent methyltransferase n=1 Tax=Lentibacillus sp. JNUCC-1 TaxID=2654513 RepID=UPI0012E86A7C|nr:class I SAM-dependent methyltransferase [Lentibacillus sp. JNUCC-1]MUV38744.1 uncharacterized protein [Lentibacillus sp. JNUCC-1]
MKQNIYDDPQFFKNYITLRESGVTYNDFIEQPAIKSMIPDLRGKTVLDLGCGDGHFSKYCVENGAQKVIGVDISENMIERANKINSDQRIEFMRLPMEDLTFAAGQTFDVIISSLAIHYIRDYSALIQNMYEMLANNGEFIFSIEHPIVTARKGSGHWVKDEEGTRQHWALDHYQEEGLREHDWFVDGVVVYHRTISTLINTLIENGFALNRILEPQSTPAGIEKMPKLINETRRPSFLVLKATIKP